MLTVTGIDINKRVMHEVKSLAQRHADIIGKFEWRRAGAAVCTVDYNKVRIDLRLEHRLADGEEFPRMANTKLESGTLVARKVLCKPRLTGAILSR